MSTFTDQNVNEEQLTLAVGDVNQIKLLGVTAYKPGTGRSTDRSSGAIISEKSMELLKLWHCENSVVST